MKLRLLLTLLLAPFFVSLHGDEEDPSLFTPDQMASILTDEEELIGGIVSPSSGTPCLRENDFVVKGAQEISLDRIYVAPHMPFLFHKHNDADSYIRYEFIRRNYEGWKFFPHIRVLVNSKKKEIRWVSPNGADYDLSYANFSILNTYAINNLGPKDTPSAKADIRNTKLVLENGDIKITTPEGTTYIYRCNSSGGFLLQKEILPSGKVLKYYYDSTHLIRIDSLDPKERYIYATLYIEGRPMDGSTKFSSSNSLNASYTFDNRHVQGKCFIKKSKQKYGFALPPLLTKVLTPRYKNEISTHAENILLTSFSGENKDFILNHTGFGEAEKKHYRVDKIFLPTGPEDSFIPVYEMSYEPAIAGEKEGKSIVRNRDGSYKVYYISKELLTTSIHYFAADETIKKIKNYNWDDKNRLNYIEWKDPTQKHYLRKNYEYDTFGNPIIERITGNLTGSGKQETYTIQRTFSQDGFHLLLKEEREEGKIITYTYLPKTNLITSKTIGTKDEIAQRETYQYDDCHNLITKTFESGKKRLLTRYILRQHPPFLHLPEWIEEKYIENNEESLLKRTHLTYDIYGNISEEKIYDANGKFAYSIFKEYNPAGDLLSETNPLEQKKHYTYDQKGRCIEETNFSGNLKERKAYDAMGRVKNYSALGEKCAHHASYQYDPHDRLLQKTDTYGNAFTYTYDPVIDKAIRSDFPPIINENGTVETVVTFSTYDFFGREISKTDANGNTTKTSYNIYGSPTEITYPDGSKEYYTYSKNGQKETFTDRNGFVTHYIYDPLGRLLTTTYGNDLASEHYLYDGFQLAGESDKNGNWTHYTYDGAGRKITEEKCNRRTTYAYDSLGRLTTHIRGGVITHYKKDLEGRTIEKTKSDLAQHLLYKITYTYDPDGNLNAVTRYIDGKTSTDIFTFDPFGRETLHKDPLGNTTLTIYNENHKNSLGQKVLQHITLDPDQTITLMTKDALSHVVKEEILSPEKKIISSREKYYDPSGNLTTIKENVYQGENFKEAQLLRCTYTKSNQLATQTRAYGTPKARTTAYTYTKSGQLGTKTLPDKTKLHYTYHPLGYLQQLRSSDGKIHHTFAYNPKGELLQATDELDKITITRTLDPFGNVLIETFPYGTLKKSYDDNDRLTTLTLPDHSTIQYQYNPLFLTKLSRYSSQGEYHHTIHYDLDGNPLSENMIHGCGTLHRTYDIKGRPITLTSPYFSQQCRYDCCDNLIENLLDQNTSTYTYDPLSQLQSENETTYTHDSLYNRTSKDDTPIKTNLLNELTTYTYDLNGNQLTKGDRTYTYDPLNRLIKTTSGDKTISFQYDPLGRLLTKITEQEEEHYLYHGQHEIGTLKTLKILGPELRKEQPSTIAIELDGVPFAPLLDIQGNITRLIDPRTKKITHHYTYTAFGDNPNPTDANPWRYASKRFDPDLQLYIFGKRFYDPTLARWLTPDPAGTLDSINLYQYAYNNPYYYYDPHGEFLFFMNIPINILFHPTVIYQVYRAARTAFMVWKLYQALRMITPAISEETCYDIVTAAGETASNTKMDRRSKKKNHDDPNYPGTPKDLENNPEWEETTHPEQRKNGVRKFKNKKTGKTIRYDKGDPNKSGHGASDHYHWENPDAPRGAKGDKIRYLDKDGNPVHDGSDESHHYPPEGVSWE